MKRSLQVKLLLILVVALGSLWSLWPTFRMAQSGFSDLPAEEQASIKSGAIKRGLDLEGGMYVVLEVDTTDLPEEVTEEEAVDRSIEVLRRRVDQFGISEPVIQKEGGTRIVVQLPGISDRQRAIDLIGKTAQLQFRLLSPSADVTNYVTRLDQVLSGVEPEDAGIETAANDSIATDIDAVLDSSPVVDAKPLTSVLGPYYPSLESFVVALGDIDGVNQMIANEDVARLPRDFDLLWGEEDAQTPDGRPARLLYAVDTFAQVAGDDIDTAATIPDTERPPALAVSLRLSRRGGIKFANVTGANVDRRMAIVLDDKVISAPVIRGKIPGGQATISGGFATDEEARDLALLLRAGALPAPVNFEYERTVGASLGQDSIRQGVRSVMIGGILVVIFMIIYYKLAGVLATCGLVLTLVFLLGILARLGLTLTLPGIAGIILTVGMAVDANVLIFERIREELRNQKSVRAAIDSGYAMATRAIVDANITTFIAAVVLFYFGTGPIKGFAVTLSIGILTSMFSALVFSRSIYELWLGDRAPKKLSI